MCKNYLSIANRFLKTENRTFLMNCYRIIKWKIITEKLIQIIEVENTGWVLKYCDEYDATKNIPFIIFISRASNN